MGDLGVELQAKNGKGRVANRRERAGGGAGQRHELGRHAVDLIAVAHPDFGL